MWRTGYEQWGEGQADAYFDLISAAIDRLAEFPEMGRSREDVRAGYRSLAVRQHLVFYTFAGELVTVRRVLSAGMDYELTELDRIRQAPSTLERLIGHADSASDPRSGPSLQALVDDLKTSLASDPDGLHRALTQAFGDKADAAALDRLGVRIVSGDLPRPSAIVFVDPGSLGEANRGAYDASEGGTIRLDRRLLANPQQLRAVFAEEMGHHLDTVLGGADAAGDEGEIFARSLLGGGLGADTLARLQAQQDRGFITRNALFTQVEFFGRSVDSPTPNPHPPSPSRFPSPSPDPSPRPNPHPPSPRPDPTPNPHPPMPGGQRAYA